ncbi:sugar ABC transporter substrate-binding protein [Peribacillus saganii]|uniref:Sugar ABC transporter substrate-binding protein n=1 Tax=Peribacillus saganii TaxID=2303992 RepID=A0A372LRW5_9BACI|nr:sugar ABC transporter substrate-binding protein [Peribacillus saganii]RFU70570.1 sugar ABC transporter substrate-binding protein [Peribacillus saganii]
MSRKVSLIVLIFSLFLTACNFSSGKAFEATKVNSSETTHTGQPAAKKNFKADKPRIAYFSAGASNTYLQAGISAAEETALNFGADIDIFDGQLDPAKQYYQVQTAIEANKYDAFVVQSTDGEKLCDLVTKDAINKGITIAVINSTMCGAKDWHKGTVTFVSGQQYDVYEGIVRKIFTDNPEGGKIAAISGPETSSNAINMRKAFAQMLQEYPQWKLIGFFETDYTSNQSFEVTQNIVQSNPDLKVIFSNYSGVTVGTAEAVRAANRNNIKIYDFGGDQWAFQALEDGLIEMSTIMLPYKEVQRAIEAVFASFEGKEVNKIIDLTKDPVLPGTPYVTNENIQQFRDKGLPEY